MSSNPESSENISNPRLDEVQITEPGAEDKPLLEIRDLEITFNTATGKSKGVRNASLTVMPGQTVAIVGESGSGKSTTALAAIGLLANNGSVTGGKIIFDGEDITDANEKRITQLRDRKSTRLNSSHAR